jgi:ATP-dependent 26S proteasome regulatory subunit
LGCRRRPTTDGGRAAAASGSLHKDYQDEKDSDKSKYVINVKQIAKFVVNLGERVSPTDIEKGMRVG